MHYRYRLLKTTNGWKALNLQTRKSIVHENKDKLIMQLRDENESKYVKVRKNNVIVTINAVET